jgi:hypothetical protein
MQIARIRLSDKISRLHPRGAAAELGQAYILPAVDREGQGKGVNFETVQFHCIICHGCNSKLCLGCIKSGGRCATIARRALHSSPQISASSAM